MSINATDTDETTGKISDVLVIEDSKTQALRMKFLLEGQNYDVEVAVNGKAGLQRLKEKRFSLVLTDWIMPEMDGVEFCRAVREAKLPYYVYIIIMTAQGLKENLITGIQAGADDYLIKPVDAEEMFARIIAAQRVISLEQSLKERTNQVELLSITDPLTGSYNRRYLNDNLDREIKRSVRYKHPLSVVICDLDHFNKVNDQYGHLVGDDVLRKFVENVKGQIRLAIDWVARYGGEEFLIVLPETDAAGAHRASDRIREAFAATIVESEQGPVSATASFGIACYSGKNNEMVNMEAMIKLADGNLYKAKEQGRNCIVGTEINEDEA